ncbi:ferritin family protein [candidate division KSB1 bacterium]|nr:ferritin family protein [candidate division KSB1 bacterium]
MPINVSELTIQQALAISMKSEQDSERVYKQLHQMVNNFVLKDKLDFLMKEEQKHQKIIQKLYEKIANKKELKTADQAIYPALSLALEESNTVPDLIELAMYAEKAAEEFYDQLSEEAEEKGVQEILQYLTSMEHSHYFLLKGEYDLCIADESYYERDDFHTDMVHIGP